MIVSVTTTPLASLGDGQLEPLGAELSSCIGRVCRCVDAPLLRTHEGREAVVVRRAGLGAVARPGAAVTAPIPRAADRTHRESNTVRRQKWAINHVYGAPRRGGISFGGVMESIVDAARAKQAQQDVACPTG